MMTLVKEPAVGISPARELAVASAKSVSRNGQFTVRGHDEIQG